MKVSFIAVNAILIASSASFTSASSPKWYYARDFSWSKTGRLYHTYGSEEKCPELHKKKWLQLRIWLLCHIKVWTMPSNASKQLQRGCMYPSKCRRWPGVRRGQLYDLWPRQSFLISLLKLWIIRLLLDLRIVMPSRVALRRLVGWILTRQRR